MISYSLCFINIVVKLFSSNDRAGNLSKLATSVRWLELNLAAKGCSRRKRLFSENVFSTISLASRFPFNDILLDIDFYWNCIETFKTSNWSNWHDLHCWHGLQIWHGFHYTVDMVHIVDMVYTVYTVDTVYYVYMVHTVDMIYTIDMAYPVHMVYTAQVLIWSMLLTWLFTTLTWFTLLI